MRRFLLVYILVILVACNQEQLDLCKSNHIYAEVEALDEHTKTSLNSSNVIIWSHEDYVAAFLNSTKSERYVVSDNSVGTPNGDFIEAPIGGGGLSSGNELGVNALVYPYESDLIFSNNEVSGEKVLSYKIERISIPSVQKYQKNSFPDDSFIMVAITKNDTDYNFKFKNASGALKLQLKGNLAVKSITLQGKSGELLSGDGTVIVSPNDTPKIVMSDSASEIVTLDCGEGVQLNEREATLFMLGLPPTQFKNGFVITITDTFGKIQKISTSKSNTINRSRSLRMPELTLSASNGESVDDENGDYGDSGNTSDDNDDVSVSISLNLSSLKLYVGDATSIKATVKPRDYVDQNIIWTSDNPEVVTVDQSGRVVALSTGVANIFAKVAGAESYSKIIVSPLTDYVDEFGVNHGIGVAIGNAIWAPVNCGYHKDNYKYGKLYQWGRKYGQGYIGNYWDSNLSDWLETSDLTWPRYEEGGVSKTTGNLEDNANVLYTSSEEYNYDWTYPQKSNLWNSGSPDNPVKTEYDPCPVGWRVPTYLELDELSRYFLNRSEFTINNLGQQGYWYSGIYPYYIDGRQVFLPNAGQYFSDGWGGNRGNDGLYWSSSTGEINGFQYSYALTTYDYPTKEEETYMYAHNRVEGLSVRCVLE